MLAAGQGAETKLQCVGKAKEKTAQNSVISLFLTNARFVVNKTDELRLQLEDNRLTEDCCALIIFILHYLMQL